MSTNVVSGKNIKRDWVFIDAKDQILGRLAVIVALKLRGKNKTNFVPYQDLGDYVVVTNAAKIKVTGKKVSQKVYNRHSGFPGGFKQEVYADLLERRPEVIIRRAVRGMLPKNKLGDKLILKLHVFAGEKHNFEKQLNSKTEQPEVIVEVAQG